MTVATTATGVAVLAVNSGRVAVLLKSLSTNTETIYLKVDSSATVLTSSNGFPLAPGESFTLAPRKDGNGPVWRDAVRAITAANTADLRYVELS